MEIYRKQVAIECDGANFHDRLPEQGIRDRKRDRALLALGLQVVRFGGSEVWRDSFACAAQVLDFLEGSVEAQQAACMTKRCKPIKGVPVTALSKATLA
jgi:very-short-patch-repair endonuclease